MHHDQLDLAYTLVIAYSASAIFALLGYLLWWSVR